MDTPLAKQLTLLKLAALNCDQCKNASTNKANKSGLSLQTECKEIPSQEGVTSKLETFTVCFSSWEDNHKVGKCLDMFS